MTPIIQIVFAVWVAFAIAQVFISIGRILLAFTALIVGCMLQTLALLLEILYSLWRTAFLD